MGRMSLRGNDSCEIRNFKGQSNFDLCRNSCKDVSVTMRGMIPIRKILQQIHVEEDSSNLILFYFIMCIY